MKSLGIVVEYNPLHNGHLHHIEQARSQSNADVVIAVMSGYFLQRGEPAFVSKWQRTKMALEAGVDIVLELPYFYSTQKAECFAEGAMQTLSEFGSQVINFGSEEGNIEPFHSLLQFMKKNKKTWDHFVKEGISTGVSYPRAASEAFSKLGAPNSMLSLSEPNNILGYHYVKAIHDLNLPMQATTIVRKQAHYHEETIPKASIASATSIRKSLSNHNTLSKVKHVVPAYTYNLLQDYFNENQMFHTWEKYFPFIQYHVLTSSHQELQQIYECEEGLEFRAKETMKQATSFEEWMTLMKTKRYTRNRLQRYATHILTKTTKEEIRKLTDGPPPYIRLLGMSSTGQTYLNKQKSNFSLPLITRFSQAKGTLAILEERVVNAYFSPLNSRISRLKEEYSTPPIRK
ncbi:nucleotidyltransferase [Bacillus solitudinis]|uniref:nucleotidyltransferase n=1 Tax=Bacillus solitudinis TaxID=2014074 RepID=UPI000C23B22F|nr:nucleotidyltransferase [Bacillus solitudinis]